MEDRPLSPTLVDLRGSQGGQGSSMRGTHTPLPPHLCTLALSGHRGHTVRSGCGWLVLHNHTERYRGIEREDPGEPAQVGGG